ncbi:hypothetical protein BaRGS_00026965 [Batillaria attramentaria]|uniref:protein-tyrosine-phosphatase n=1 Tax=Batillaria attramentaria TaxID=370345 RepID=A0ABD0K421_9CAEN
MRRRAAAPGGCSSAYYGPFCQKCGAGCVGGTCNQNGHCRCTPGWQPRTCSLGCSSGWYGQDCTTPCGTGCLGNTCNAVNGECTCKPGWSGPMCTTCAVGYYGPSCQKCGAGCLGDKCAPDGHCTCHPGWQPGNCTKRCLSGHYGQNCTVACGAGCQGNTCDPEHGNCTCNSTKWKTGLCAECPHGKYGDGCNSTCGVGCQGNNCDDATGVCTCGDGWSKPLCDACNSSSWGSTNCSLPCGHCAGDGSCDIVSGNCTHGCSNGFDGSACFLKLESEDVSVGGVVDAQRTTPTSKDKPTVPVKPMKRGGADSEEQAGHTYGNTSASAEHVYSNVPAPSNGQSISKTVRPPVAAPRPSAKPSRGNVYENVQLSGAARQRPEPPPKPAAVSRVSSGAGQKADEYEEEEDVYNTEDLYACYNTVSTKPQLDALQKYLLEALASGELSAQFGEFAKGMTLPHKDGMSEENVRKNRFKAMCAYDFNRVHLHRPKGDPDTDYINASYIKGCRGDKQYIATQGPRDTHVNDLWWMVWQEKATQVVMLTNLIEDGKDKCEEYWPAAGKTQTYGHVTVRGLEVEERADFVIRPFTLKVKGAGERQVTQYHFNTWPDHGVPQASALVDFWRYVKARGNPRVPLIVHCSAGVGRTGTFIALDIASELEAGGREVNVQQIVIELREQRCIMVQSEAQYKFLHEVILEAHTSRDTRIPVDKFEETFPSHISVNHHNHRIDREFKMLEEMGKYRPKRSYRMANMKENIDKNRNQDAVPDDDHVVYLNVHVRGRNQYINAVYMSSLKKRQGLVLTQLPIPNKTLVDFWRMVDGCHVNTIVSIGSQNEEETVENYCRFWPPADTKSITTGPYVITLVSLNVLSDHLSSYSLRLTQKGENKVGEVQLLHYKDWAGELPDDMSSLIQLVDTVKAEDDASSPIVIQCIDGAAKSGLFCAIYDIINRLTYDDEIDVYMTARYVQSIRPQAVSTEAQYRFLYKVAQEYISHLSVYQNTNVRA